MAEAEAAAASVRVKPQPASPSRVESPVASSPVAYRRRGRLLATIVTLRPKQWLKNLLVIAAAGAAGALGRDDVPVRVGLAFVAFCLLASGIYAINDARDAEEDRLHPSKRFRPIAAGEISPRYGIFLGAALILAGMGLCAGVRPLLAAVGGAYVVLTVSYTLVWRNVPVLDIFAIAGGFVLRAVAGGAAAPVALSRWFLLVVTAAAVFVAAGKREAELRRTQAALAAGALPATEDRRHVLNLYTAGRLRLILLASAVVTIIAYAVWAFELPSVHGVPWRPLTIIPMAACLARYGMLLGSGAGEAPEELVLRDRRLLIAGAVWLLLFAVGVHAAA